MLKTWYCIMQFMHTCEYTLLKISFLDMGAMKIN